MRIAIVGLGLIGGSLARALSARTEHAVYGLDIDSDPCKAAVEQGAVRGIVSPMALDEFDLIWVCLHPQSAVRFIREYADRFAKGATVADVCGVKAEICSAVEEMLAAKDVNFVGAHPMAGREYSGFSASDESLFDRASMILTQTECTNQAALIRMHSLAMDIGCERVVICSPEEHDRTIAYTSQLAHVVSSAYIKSPTASRYKGFSAGSFQDMTRVARLDENLWTELFLANREPLIEEIACMIAHLDEYRIALEADDEEMLRGLLRDGRLRKESTDKW